MRLLMPPHLHENLPGYCMPECCAPEAFSQILHLAVRTDSPVQTGVIFNASNVLRFAHRTTSENPRCDYCRREDPTIGEHR